MALYMTKKTEHVEIVHNINFTKRLKDESNQRFDFIQNKYRRRVDTKMIQMKYKINARDFRRDILEEKSLKKYFPTGIQFSFT